VQKPAIVELVIREKESACAIETAYPELLGLCPCSGCHKTGVERCAACDELVKGLFPDELVAEYVRTGIDPRGEKRRGRFS